MVLSLSTADLLAPSIRGKVTNDQRTYKLWAGLLLYTSLYVHLYTSLYISIHLYTSLYVHLYTSLYVHLYTSLYISICTSLCEHIMATVKPLIKGHIESESRRPSSEVKCIIRTKSPL